MIRAHRIGDAPIIDQGMCESLGDNINGPSVVARPDWAPGEGRFLLYFSHHKGTHIRLATADRMEGPWAVHRPGVLPLSATPLAQTRPDLPQPAWAQAAGQDGLYPHLASPDVWLDEEARLFRMLFHGLAGHGEQVSYAATSRDGLKWQVEGAEIPLIYLRRFVHEGQVYAMGHGGQLSRQREDGGFEPGPFPLAGKVRHVAVLQREDRLHVLFTRIGDCPERILHTELDLSRAWPDWRVCVEETEVLRPNLAWEGTGAPLTPSEAGAVDYAHQLRDPELIEADGDLWLVYAGGGEAALGLARLSGI